MYVDWFQVAAFGELGRVAPEWKIDTLHEDMKWTLGAGVRAMANNIVVRADLGVSSEEVIVQMFIGQPFWDSFSCLLPGEEESYRIRVARCAGEARTLQLPCRKEV